jgi:hypothetical protein
MPCPRAPTKSAVKRVAVFSFGWYMRIRKDEEEIGRAGVSWPGLVIWDMHMDGYYPFWKFRSLSNFALTFIHPAIPIPCISVKSKSAARMALALATTITEQR